MSRKGERRTVTAPDVKILIYCRCMGVDSLQNSCVMELVAGHSTPVFLLNDQYLLAVVLG